MIKVQREEFDVGAELRALGRGNRNIGGIASFVGVVRNTAEPAGTGAMTLEHYPGMTERKLVEIENEALSRWPLDAVTIIHRYGRLEPGDPIVLVATASAHRAAALESCQFLIDWLKTEAPFWKFEESVSGGQWVAARSTDDVAAARWSKKKPEAAE